MIKVCYIIGQLGKGGAEKQLYELVKGINRERFYPIVISLSEGGYWREEIKKLNVNLIEIRREKSRDLIRLIRLISLLRKIKPSIIHTYMFSANTYGRIASLIARIPVIISSERNIVEAGKDEYRYWRYIDKFLTSFTHGIICNSYNTSTTLINKYSFNANKIYLIPNGIDVNSFSNAPYFNSENKSTLKIVGTVGRLYTQKNHILFLNMAKEVLNILEGLKIKFIIIGDGPLRNELEGYAKKLGIKQCIEFTGERYDIPELLQSMDIFVMTSLYEGMSNAIMEAMASRLPCVVTDVGGNSELVIDGETGYVIPPNDPEAMAQKVSYLLENDGLARKMGEKGKKRMEEDFNMEKMIKTTEEIYEKLMNGKVYHA